MDLIDSLKFLDQHWDDCIEDKDVSDAIDNDNPFESFQAFAKSETFKSANSFFETFLQNKKTTSFIELVSNISANYQEVTSIYDQFLSIDFNLTLNQNKDIDIEGKLKNINEALYFLSELRPLFSRKFHDNDFCLNNKDEKNFEYLEKLKKIGLLIKSYPNLYELYPDLQNYQKIFKNAQEVNSSIIISAFKNEIDADKVEKVKKYYNYHKELFPNLEELRIIKGKSTYTYVKSMITNRLKSNKKIQFNYHDTVVCYILQKIPNDLPKDIDLSTMPEEIQFIYFVIYLPIIIKKRIKNLDEVFGNGLQSTFYDAFKRYFSQQNPNINPFGEDFLLFDEYFEKKFGQKMSANFIFSAFSNPQNNELEDYIRNANNIYIDFIKRIRVISLKCSNDYFDYCFKESDGLISKIKSFVKAGNDLNLILDKKFTSVKFPQKSNNIDKMRSDQSNYVRNYINGFKSMCPFLEQISLYKLNLMPENNWNNFLNRCENLQFIKRIESIHLFFDEYALLFYAMVNHYLINVKNNEKLFLMNNFLKFIKNNLINNQKNSHKFVSLSYQNLIDSAFELIKINVNKAAPFIKDFYNANKDMVTYHVTVKLFVEFFAETLLKYLYTIYPQNDYPKLREDLRNKLVENRYLDR